MAAEIDIFSPGTETAHVHAHGLPWRRAWSCVYMHMRCRGDTRGHVCACTCVAMEMRVSVHAHALPRRCAWVSLFHDKVLKYILFLIHSHIKLLRLCGDVFMTAKIDIFCPFPE
jgi:hypothetical protein